MNSITSQLENADIDDKVFDLAPMHRLFVDTFTKNNYDKKATASELGKSSKQIDTYLCMPKISKAIEYYKRGLTAMPNTVAPADYKVEKASQIKLLWDIAQTAAGMIYDREGNEVLMNPAGAIAAVRTISDLQGDFAPKEQHVTVDVKDDRSIEEIQTNVHALMAEYQQLATRAGATEGQVTKMLEMPDNLKVN